MRRRTGCGFLRSGVLLFFLWCLCISGFFFVVGFWRYGSVGVAVVPPGDCESSPYGSSSGEAARRSCQCRNSGSVVVDIGARWASILLQFVDCHNGVFATAVGFNWKSTEIYLLNESSDGHQRVAISITWILEQEATGEVYCFSWCLPCIMESRQDDKQADDDVSHPSELTHRRQMREPLSMILRFDGRDTCNLGSVLLPTDLQLNCPKPQVHLPARLLGEPLALRLARTREVPEDCGCGCALDFSPRPPSGSGGCLLRHLYVCCISWFHIVQFGTTFVIPHVGV